MENETQIAHSYIRWSTKDQSKGSSEGRQTDSRLERFCTRHRLALSGLTIRDAGVSGFRGKNAAKGELAGFLKAIEDGTVKADEWLVIENIDRLSRMPPLDAFNLILKIIGKGIVIGVIDSDMVLTTASLNDTNRGELNMLMGEINRAHRESRRKSELVAESWTARRQRAAKTKQPQAGRYPAWVKLVNGKFELEPTNTATMMQIAEWLLGGRGYEWIAGQLSRNKVPTFNRKNGIWSSRAIRYLANSRTTIGEYQPGKVSGVSRTPVGEPIPNYYPAVWTEETRTRIQAIIATRRRAVTQGRTGDEVTNLFGQVLQNGNDNTVVRIKRGNMISAAMIVRVTPYCQFNYAAFEYHALKWISEIKLTNHTDNSRFELLEAQHTETTAKIAAVSARLEKAAAAEYPRMLDLLANLETTEKAQAKAIEIERAMNAQPRSTAEVVRLADQMHKMPKAERVAIRARLRIAIAAVVNRISFFPFRAGHKQLAIVQVQLKGEKIREFVLKVEPNREPTSLSSGAIFDSVESYDLAKLAAALLEQDGLTPAMLGQAHQRIAAA